MAHLKVYTVFLPVKHRKMLKLFNKVTNPDSRSFAKYGKHDYFDKRWEEAARNFFKKFRGAALRKTLFPGVLRLITTEEERGRYFVPPFYRIKEEEDFEKIEQSLMMIDQNETVHILEGEYTASRKFKKRVNLVLIDLALRGHTILAPAHSFFGEMPAITSYNTGAPPKFSDHFKRKKYANYQDFLVKNYLFDPLIVGKLKEMKQNFDGRALPDITLLNPKEFVETVKNVNQKRVNKGLPTLGFMNPVLYTNAKIFKRNVQEERHGFPFSVTLWRPNVGLGEPQNERFFDLLS